MSMDGHGETSTLHECLLTVEPPQGLLAGILVRVHKEEKRRSRQKALLFGGSAVASLTATISLWSLLAHAATQSGFYHYISLLLSGDSAIYIYWRELMLSLVDSLPVFALLGFLSTVVFLVWSAAHTFTHTRRYIVHSY